MASSRVESNPSFLLQEFHYVDDFAAAALR